MINDFYCFQNYEVTVLISIKVRPILIWQWLEPSVQVQIRSYERVWAKTATIFLFQLWI